MSVNSTKSAKNEDGKKRILSWPIIGLILIVCLWLAFVLTGKVLCKIALDQIAELTDTEITTESVDFSINGSVFIKKLVIRPKQRKKYDDTILKAETVYVRFGIGSLFLLHPTLKKINVKDFFFDVQYDLDVDRWNIDSFIIKPPKGSGGKMPIIRLRDGTLQYSKISNGQIRTVAAVPIDFGFEPVGKTQDGCRFSIVTADRVGRGRSVLAGFWKPGRITITGGIALAEVPALEETWEVDTLDAELNYDSSNFYFLKLKIEDARSKHIPVTFNADKEALVGKLGPFAALQRFFNRYQPSGTIDLEIEVSGNLERLSESKLVGKVNCKDVSICDRRFPYTIKQLVGRLDLTERSTVLNNLRGRHGDTELIFNGWLRGFGPNFKYKIQITSNKLALDNDLYEALSGKQKKFWSAFSPSGFAVIDYNLSRRSQTDKKITLMAELLGAEAAYSEFPYPLKNLCGKLFFTYDSVTVSDVVSEVDDCKITLNGKVTACNTEQPIYDISIQAKDVPLDSTLASSLSGTGRDFYNQLNMTGLADADIKVFTPEQSSDPISFIADVFLKKTSLKAEDFPLLVSDISAKTTITPECIQVEDFKGHHNQTIVSLRGQIWPNDKSPKPPYCLLLNAEQTELKDELISLLPEQLQKIVTELQPEGEVNLIADLNKTDSNKYPDYKITVDCLGNSINFEPFNYSIKDINGQLTITRNTFALEDITATVASMDNALITSNILTVKVNGRIVLTEDAFNIGQLGISNGYISFTADNLRIKGKSLTILKADAYYDPNKRSWITKNLVADCYGGRLTGKFELRRPAEESLEYLLQVGFDNIDLKQFLLDTKLETETPRGNHTSGRMSGLLSVAGQPGESLPYIGRCRLIITDMQVGTLSPLAKLLYALELTEPKDFAFEQMFVDSYIQHDRLFIERLDLSGKAIAFDGSGRIDLQSHDTNLTLFARGRRIATAEPSVLQSMTEVLGQAVVRMDVTGNVYDPQVTTKILPVVGEAVKILGTPQR